eukprot:UN02635
MRCLFVYNRHRGRLSIISLGSCKNFFRQPTGHVPFLFPNFFIFQNSYQKISCFSHPIDVICSVMF